MALRGYRLGCPSWGLKTWVGPLFPKGTKQADYLARYSRIFNTVEGNTTFYALPKADTVSKWKEVTPSSFRFCFKFPKKVTHEKLLNEDTKEYVDGFLRQIAPLGDKLGTLTVQLPPRFGPKQLPRTETFLTSLSTDFRYAVELRHPAFFDRGDHDRAAAEMLTKRNVDTVIMDARGLHSSSAPELEDVRRRKPNLPIIMRATGPQPIVRIVPHEDFEAGLSFVKPWLDKAAEWIVEGREPYFFLHAPDDSFAPDNAYRFHELLSEYLGTRGDIGDLPPRPNKKEGKDPAGGGSQLGLF